MFTAAVPVTPALDNRTKEQQAKDYLVDVYRRQFPTTTKEGRTITGYLRRKFKMNGVMTKRVIKAAEEHALLFTSHLF